jgi:hypothetical protein
MRDADIVQRVGSGGFGQAVFALDGIDMHAKEVIASPDLAEARAFGFDGR